jgi:hypothetical protein
MRSPRSSGKHFIATRGFVDREVLPAINEYWEAPELPWPLMRRLAEPGRAARAPDPGGIARRGREVQLLPGRRLSQKSLKDLGLIWAWRRRMASGPPPRLRPAHEEGPALQGRFRWRDPDSNRGHHDFQSCASPGLKPPKSLESSGVGPEHRVDNISHFRTFFGACGNDRHLRPNLTRAVRAASEVPCTSSPVSPI